MRLIKFRRILRLFLIGTVGYTLIEILWRGHTHWTMSITGGVCFVLIYTIWRRLFAAPWYRVCLCCAAAVTGVEFVVGCIVNLLLGWNVWNYEPVSYTHLSYGHTGFTGTSIYVDNKTGVYVVLLTNRVHPSREDNRIIAFRRHFHNTVFASLEE